MIMMIDDNDASWSLGASIFSLEKFTAKTTRIDVDISLASGPSYQRNLPSKDTLKLLILIVRMHAVYNPEKAKAAIDHFIRKPCLF